MAVPEALLEHFSGDRVKNAITASRTSSLNEVLCPDFSDSWSQLSKFLAKKKKGSDLVFDVRLTNCVFCSHRRKQTSVELLLLGELVLECVLPKD